MFYLYSEDNFYLLSGFPIFYGNYCQLVYLLTYTIIAVNRRKFIPTYIPPNIFIFSYKSFEKAGAFPKKIPLEKLKRDCCTLYLRKIILSLLFPQHPYNQDIKTCCKESA